MPVDIGTKKQKETVNVPMDAEHLKQLLEYTFRDKKNESLKTDIVNYILTQFNEDSLQGVLDYLSYKQAFSKAADGLFCIVYFQHYEVDLVDRDVYFASSYDLLILLYSRVLGGKHYDLLRVREAAKQNVIMQR